MSKHNQPYIDTIDEESMNEVDRDESFDKNERKYVDEMHKSVLYWLLVTSRKRYQRGQITQFHVVNIVRVNDW